MAVIGIGAAIFVGMMVYRNHETEEEQQRRLQAMASAIRALDAKTSSVQKESCATKGKLCGALRRVRDEARKVPSPVTHPINQTQITLGPIKLSSRSSSVKKNAPPRDRLYLHMTDVNDVYYGAGLATRDIWTSSGGVLIADGGCLETGAGVVGKEKDAGKICYGNSSKRLDIYGNGDRIGERVVDIHDRLFVDELAVRKGMSVRGNTYVRGGLYVENVNSPIDAIVLGVDETGRGIRSTGSGDLDISVDDVSKMRIKGNKDGSVMFRGPVEIGNYPGQGRTGIIMETSSGGPDGKNIEGGGLASITFKERDMLLVEDAGVVEGAVAGATALHSPARVASTKQIWRMGADQRGTFDKFGIGATSPQGQQWMPLTLEDGVMKINAKVQLCDSNGQNCMFLEDMLSRAPTSMPASSTTYVSSSTATTSSLSTAPVQTTP